MKRLALLPLFALVLPTRAEDPATNAPAVAVGRSYKVNGVHYPATNAQPAAVGRSPSERNRSRSEKIDESGRYRDPELQSLCEAMRGLFRQIRDGLPEGWTMEETEDTSLGRSLLPEPSFFAAISPPGHMLGRWCFSRLEAAEQIPGTNRFERIALLDDETWLSSYCDILERNAETLVCSNRISGFTITKKITSLNRGIVVLTNDYVAVHLTVFSPAREWADWDGFAQSVRDTLAKADWSAFQARRDNAGKPSPAPATPSPAEETHAESAENAEPEPHAEPAEGAKEPAP